MLLAGSGADPALRPRHDLRVPRVVPERLVPGVEQARAAHPSWRRALRVVRRRSFRDSRRRTSLRTLGGGIHSALPAVSRSERRPTPRPSFPDRTRRRSRTPGFPAPPSESIGRSAVEFPSSIHADPSAARKASTIMRPAPGHRSSPRSVSVSRRKKSRYPGGALSRFPYSSKRMSWIETAFFLGSK